ncbi:hypothetical protein ABID21_004571 [Pseudorhizobium tarimense]|uniref:Uncharacterized protein n=1 Tax=Pseudorhizobium tarimense TaxID=1079109 RepID=A0ABV2HCZ8_9HYPH
MAALQQVEGQEPLGPTTSSRLIKSVPDLHRSTTAKMDFLHNLMRQQDRPAEGMSWRLLLLECGTIWACCSATSATG